VVFRSPIAGTSSALIVAVFVALLAAPAGCAHARSPNRAPATPDERIDQFLASLPACASTAGTFAVADVEKVRGRVVKLRGHLVYAPFCTAMKCQDACCNQCRGSWELGEARDASAPSILLHAVDERWRRTQWAARDCELPALRARSAAVTIIVTGTLRRTSECSSLDRHSGPLLSIRDELVYTAMCAARPR
jgi:hypothetical protein